MAKPDERFDMDETTCKLDGCERPGRASGGWCYAHWNRVRRNGDPGSPVVKDRRVGCLVDGCESKHFGHGYCQTHLYRLRENGDPLLTRPPGYKPGEAPTGPEAPTWNGGTALYSAVHHRLRRMFGDASSHSCIDCAGPAHDWSYRHGSPDEAIDHKGRVYSTDLDWYEPRCVPCHRRYDLDHAAPA